MKATRESDSKETASDEKDLSLKHFPVFIFAAYSSFFSLSPLSLWICFLFFQAIPSYFWHKVINSVNENESSLLLYQCSAGNFSSSHTGESCSHNYQAATWERSGQKQNHWCPSGRIQIQTTHPFLRISWRLFWQEAAPWLFPPSNWPIK